MSEDVIIPLAGRLTFSENAGFREIVIGLEKHGAAKVVFDLAALDLMDSTGLGMLLVARETVTEQGGHVALRNATGQVGRMLDLARFGDFFTMEQV
ncbi:MAG: STAS domain-containing protein [Rhodospirillaceae bacterium]|nr:STAS domain-containing protein [Rhodospirillales bacterium]